MDKNFTMKGVDLSPPLIFRDRFDFDLDKINPIVDELMKDENAHTGPPFGIGASRTTFKVVQEKQPHFHPDNRLFVEWLGVRIRQVMKIWLDEPYPIHISNSWYNVHESGGWQDEHVHALSRWSISAYLDVPLNSGNILFRDPLHELTRNFTSESSQHPWKVVPVNTGDVLIFPSWLRHKTEVCKSADRRLIWSLNVGYETVVPEPVLHL